MPRCTGSARLVAMDSEHTAGAGTGTRHTRAVGTSGPGPGAAGSGPGARAADDGGASGRRTDLATRARDAAEAARRGLLLTLAALPGSLVLFILGVVSIALIVVGVGIATTPRVLELVRTHANRRRLWAAEWAGLRVPAPYPPMPKDLHGGAAGHVRRCFLMLREKATWRDLGWLVADFTGGLVLALLAPGLVVEGVFGILMALGLWVPLEAAMGEGFWYEFLPVDGWGPAALAGLVGCWWLAVSLFAGPRLVEAHLRFSALLLDHDRAARLNRRIDRLTATRHDAVDTSAAELRRIERDLHDGAQARLVAMGMDLGTVEALLDTDPAAARELLSRARRSSAEALTELRDLVRGIHPPVLAERGLADAIRALALRTPVTVQVHIDPTVPARLDAPVESAAYFAVSELLTNAVKHAEADRVQVDVEYTGGVLRIAVTDDGRGGAVVKAGSGLAGVERRLGTFDGVLAVTSPPGGPTVIAMEIPCA